MARYKVDDPTTEISGTLPNHESYRVKCDANGVIDCKDELVDAALARLAASDDHPLQLLPASKPKG